MQLGVSAPAADTTGGAGSGLLGDIFGLTSAAVTTVTLPKIVWLPAEKGKGLEIQGKSHRHAQNVIDKKREVRL